MSKVAAFRTEDHNPNFHLQEALKYHADDDNNNYNAAVAYLNVLSHHFRGGNEKPPKTYTQSSRYLDSESIRYVPVTNVHDYRDKLLCVNNKE